MKVQQLSEIFNVLGQPTRLDIIRLLAPISRQPLAHEPMTPGLPAGFIAKSLKVTPAALSFHLKDMTLRNILRQRKAGREIYYSINRAVILEALGELVTELEK